MGLVTDVVSSGLDPMALYAAGLAGTPVYLRHADGRRELLPTARWTAGLQPGDAGLLGRCSGSTLDVGCGPGRLTVALHRAGRAVLGLDVSSAALALARATSAPVRRGDVFDELPGVGRWSCVLLADGNIGIGGDLPRLLARCRELLIPGGRILGEIYGREIYGGEIYGGESYGRESSGGDTDTDLDPGSVYPDEIYGAGVPPCPGDPARSFRLEDGHGLVSTWFAWSKADEASVRRAADAVGLRVVESWTEAGRSFLALAHR